ncbi:hypothetical protein GCM10027160_47310 [Streptomyces calidiresistens]|uniref:Ester cyclase n=1 Tax=Streptomyces calidiresistens TaxID=1485586 RepID=A0A7W3XWD0_9ACTN|nr:ester cyclase [Streptomyces calidiresistens]MBB0229955.1 hypothetical protein [Streptomyces calidiresistens]
MTLPESLYRRWLFDLWRGDLAVAEDILAPDFRGHWPDLDVHGPDEAVEQIRRTRELFSDIDTTLDAGPVLGADMVAARWTFHGTYRGGVPGATAPAGTRVSFVGQDLFRVAGDRLAEYWVVSDVMGLMTSLGAVPAPGDRP